MKKNSMKSYRDMELEITRNEWNDLEKTVDYWESLLKKEGLGPVHRSYVRRAEI